MERLSRETEAEKERQRDRDKVKQRPEVSQMAQFRVRKVSRERTKARLFKELPTWNFFFGMRTSPPSPS